MTDFMSPAMSMKRHCRAEPRPSHHQTQKDGQTNRLLCWARALCRRNVWDLKHLRFVTVLSCFIRGLLLDFTLKGTTEILRNTAKMLKMLISIRRKPHNVVHIKQLVRQHSHQIFRLLLSPPPAWSEGGWAKPTTEWQPIFCPRSTNRVKPPTPRLHTYRISSPRSFSIRFHSSMANALANSYSLLLFIH